MVQGTARFAVGLATAFLFVLAPALASARPGPDIVSAHFDKVPVAGLTSSLVVKVRDPLASINGIRVDFGDGSQLELSSCRPESVFGPLPDEFQVGRPASFSVEHVYESAGQRNVHLVATSGDCMVGRATSELDQKVNVVAGPKKLVPGKGPLARVAAAGDLCPNALALPGSVSRAATRAAVFCLLQFVRQAFGVRPLKSNKLLTTAAQRHAADMVARDYFSHDAPDGSGLTDRLRKAHFKLHSIAGENIGAGTARYGSPLGVIIGWLNSPGHRRNMLERGFRQAGIGAAAGMPLFSGSAGAATYDLTLAGG